MQKWIWVLLLIGVIVGLQAQSHQHVVTTTDVSCQQQLTNKSSLLDWGDGVTGSVDVGTGVAGDAGYGTGLPNEEMLECVVNGFPGQVGYWFTLTIDDSTPVDLSICMDGLGYEPSHLAYWINGEWNYINLCNDWIDGCATFTLDPTITRTDVDIPIVFSDFDDCDEWDYAWIAIVELNNNCYEDGDFVEITIDIDANTEDGINVMVLTKIVDANFVTIDSTFRSLSITDFNDPFTEILTIPVGAQTPWSIQVRLYRVSFLTVLEDSHVVQIEDCNTIPGNAWIRYVELNEPCYDDGDDVDIVIEVDTGLPQQEILVEIILLDGNGVNIDVTSEFLLTYGTDDDPFTVTLTIPFDAPSPLCILVIVSDLYTNIQQDLLLLGISDCIPLPVTLSSFAAVYDNSTPSLQWTTQSESNNLGWNIYRSLSENMEQANQINDLLIPGNGTTSEPTEYVYNDLSVVESNTTYWYWLESASYNGETELHGPITLTIQDDENQLPELPTDSILHNNYPNPFNPSTMINFSINQGESGSLTIYNMRGQLIESHNYEAGEHQFNWNATQYSSGIYFYKLETQNYTNIKKMIMVK